MLASVSKGLSTLFARVHTFQGFDNLSLRRLLSDTLNHRRDELVYMSLNLIPRIAGHENVCVGIQAFGAPLGAAALEVGDLFDARVELSLPRIFGYVDIFAVEYIVDGCCAVSMSVENRARMA